jgi:hypothetical protein
VSVTLNGEAVRAAQVDMAVTDRSNAAQGIDRIPGRRALTFTLNGPLQALSIPGHHAVGEQRQRPERGAQLLSAAAALGR